MRKKLTDSKYGMPQSPNGRIRYTILSRNHISLLISLISRRHLHLKTSEEVSDFRRVVQGSRGSAHLATSPTRIRMLREII
ncbi:hypothetical protein CDAR_280081 [Caerostris darwini]|uniref:Uncharacterized protein n=1 Tax=Caerostris darwini TaxID=1538125 RepID=A0AAV4S9F6_9ARAC|nr:hypothetical protein CDAR_280081 [Caerostris darwini]